MKTKQKCAVQFALLFVFTAILIIQPLAAREIIPGQTREGELGDSDDMIAQNDRRYDIFTFATQPNESYKITLVSEAFAAASSIGLQAGVLQVAYVTTPGYQVQYSGTFNTAEQATIAVWSTQWQSVQTGKYTLNLEIIANISSGVWRGQDIAFYVAEDGKKITSNGSPLVDDNGKSFALVVESVPGKGGCSGSAATRFVADIPIESGSFEYSVNNAVFTFTIDGTFTSETESNGELSYNLDGEPFGCSGSYQKSGPWQAQATTSNGLSNTATMSPAHTYYEYTETGEVETLHILYQPVSEEE